MIGRLPTRHRAWEVVLERPLGRGTLVGVRLPTGDAEVPQEVLRRLPATERELVSGARGHRRKQLAGGRLAAARAMAAAGLPAGAVTQGDRGAPVWPTGCSGSLAHKSELAVAWVAAAEEGRHLGVDLEEVAGPNSGIASRILTDCELLRWQAEPEEERQRALVRSFAVKEAIYKALAPGLGRYIGFDEAELDWRAGEVCSARLRLRPEEGEHDIAVGLVDLAVDERAYLVAAVEVARQPPREEDGP